MSQFNLKALPPIILAFELFLGGSARLGPIPFKKLHEFNLKKSSSIAPQLRCVTPFRIHGSPQATPESTRWHMRYFGTLMVLAGVLTANPKTRGDVRTMLLTLFLTGSGVYSQVRCGMMYWLPVLNSGLAGLIWWIENRT
jgi:hypothetical protein